MSMNNIINPAFYLGVVEDRMDPLKLGRVKVRILGMHTWDKILLPTEDLPWSYKVQPSTSGAMNGIGHAPVGVMEGTWVIIQYLDPDQQEPFIVGTFGGIPQSKQTSLEEFDINISYASGGNSIKPQSTVTTSDGSPVTDSSGNPVQAGTEEDTNQPEPEPPPSDPDWKAKVTKRLGELESSNNYKAVNTLGYLGKYQFGALALTDRGYVKKGTTNAGLSNPENWTGKNGITSKEAFLNNPDVQEQVMSENIDANYKTLKRVGVPMDTLSDPEKGGLIAAAHLYGAGGAKQFYNGVVKTDAYGTSTDKYYKEGYKAVAGETPATSNIARETTNTPQQVAERNQEAIKDANPAEDQLAATLSKVDYFENLIAFNNPRVGFKDPNLKYPLKTHLDEPDTNRLARHEKIGETIVYTKEQARHTGVAKANGKGSWDQSPIPYNAKYPFNNVWQSESGHVMEFDDTQGRERVHLYHTKGTYTEIDHNGTQVNFIVGDNYVIMERNGFVHVVGNLHVKVDGAHTLKIDNTLDVQVNGRTTINCHDNAQINVAKNLDITAGGHIYMKAGGRVAIDAPRIDLNSGVASGLSTIGGIGGSPSDPNALNVITRGDEAAIDYEVPPDDPTSLNQFQQQLISNGIATKEQLEQETQNPEVQDSTKTEDNNVEEIITECGIPANQTTFTGQEVLSGSIKLADLTANYSRKLVEQNGLTPAKIFCNLKALAENVINPIKTKYPNMRINSGFRRPGDAAGSSTTSQHNTGQAVDMSFSGVSREQLYDLALEIQKLVPYDQLLLEYTTGGNGWIHVSYVQGNNRKQAFTMNNHVRVSKDLYTIVKIA